MRLRRSTSNPLVYRDIRTNLLALFLALSLILRLRRCRIENNELKLPFELPEKPRLRNSVDHDGDLESRGTEN